MAAPDQTAWQRRLEQSINRDEHEANRYSGASEAFAYADSLPGLIGLVAVCVIGVVVLVCRRLRHTSDAHSMGP